MDEETRGDIADMKKLIWRLVGIFGGILGLFFLVFGGTIFAEYKSLNEKLDKTVFIQYTEDNNKKIEKLQDDVTDIKVEQAKTSTHIESINKNIGEIKEMLKK